MITTNGGGNWPPERALIRALVERGHDVRVLSDECDAADIVEAGATYRPFRHAPQWNATSREGSTFEREVVRVVQGVVLNTAFAEELLVEVERDAPDVLLIDYLLTAATAAAEHTGLPTAMLWHTVYGPVVDDPRLRLTGSLLEPLNELRTSMGLERIDEGWGVEHTGAVLAFTYREFDTPSVHMPDHLHYVGPLQCLAEASDPYAMPWEPTDRRPLILVSYSTTFQDQVSTLQRLADAVASLPVRVLMTLGPAIRPHELRLPENVVPETFVPHAAVLPQTDLVLTHAGHATVMAAVTAGVPLVCTPGGRDQYLVAECVTRCGLGVIASKKAPPDDLRATIQAALDDEGLRERSRKFAARVDLEAGHRQAIDVLERLK